MKKSKIVIMAVLLALGTTSCYVSSGASSSASSEDVILGGEVGIPTPFVECSTLDEAYNIAGIGFKLPESINGYDIGSILAYYYGMIEVIYENENGETIELRKALGSGDISGDYREYENIEMINYQGYDIIVKSNKDKIYLGIIEGETYSYSFIISEGISKSELLKLVKSTDIY